MATYALTTLSGSTNGRLIKVVATATAGTLIHTAHATSLDKLFLWAQNLDNVTRALTIEYGGVLSPDDLLIVDLPRRTGGNVLVVPTLVVPGLHLTNSLVVRAFGAAANIILIGGYVMRVT